MRKLRASISIFFQIKRAAEVLASGCRVLVVGASGAIGTVLLQMLSKKYKDKGGNVTAVCSGANADMVKRMGADEAVDYKLKPFHKQLEAAEKFQVVFDLVGGQDVEEQAAMLIEKGGMFVTAVGANMYLAGDRKLSTSEFCA